MAELKWSGREIINFLNIFQNFECLWDVSSKDFTNKPLKENAYKQLVDILNDSGMPCTVDSIKKKVKSLRDTYRKETSKIKKSTKSGGAWEVYKPKLVWFSAAEVFWHRTARNRRPSSNTDKPAENENDESSSENESFSASPGYLTHIQPTSAANKRTSTDMEPSRGSKVFKTTKGLRKPTRFESAVEKLQNIAEMTSEEVDDEYVAFGKHIAIQLRQLPVKSFIILQSKIQNLISEERLAMLEEIMPVSRDEESQN